GEVGWMDGPCADRHADGTPEPGMDPDARRHRVLGEVGEADVQRDRVGVDRDRLTNLVRPRPAVAAGPDPERPLAVVGPRRPQDLDLDRTIADPRYLERWRHPAAIVIARSGRSRNGGR